MARHSPCIGICKLDEATGYCLGCGRTGAEVGDWIAMSEPERDAVWQKLPERLARLSARVRLLPMTCSELVDWVAAGIEAGSGTWAVGPPGASAEFPGQGSGSISVDVGPGTITARSSGASLRIAINEKVRAFAFANGGPIVLGLPKGRAVLPAITTVQTLGSDLAAIDEAQQGETLFDLGLGRRYSRFCLRTSGSASGSALSELSGRRWSDVLPAVREIMSANGVDRIVESATARIELNSKIDGKGFPIPEIVNSGEEFASRLAPPDYAAAVATFHPRET